MRRPLGAVALLYIAGILFGHNLPLALPSLFGLAFVCGISALVWKKGRPVLLAVLILLTGWASEICSRSIVSHCDLRLLIGNDAQVVTVRGTLHASPLLRLFEKPGKEFQRESVLIDCNELRLTEKWQPAHGRIVAMANFSLPEQFFLGQRVEITGVLAPPAPAKAPGLFDARVHYGQEDVYLQLNTGSLQDWQIDSRFAPASIPLADRFSKWARHTLALGLGKEDDSLHLIWTLALNWKAPVTTEVEQPFIRAGTYHIFAVDGLRIGILTTICLAFLRLLRLPRFACGLIALPVIWSYVSLTGWPASAVRAAIMISIVVGGWSLKRPTDLINSLFTAALIILIWNPSQLFQAGFQLSFTVVFFLALLFPIYRDRLYQLTQWRDPFLAQSLVTRRSPLYYFSINFVIDTIVLSLTAWLGSIPLSAAYFHLFTIYSVPANAVVVPLTVLTLVSSIGSLITGAWLPSVAMLFNQSSWFLVNCITYVSKMTAQWPVANWHAATPPPFTMCFYYLVLGTLGTGWIFKTRRRLKTGCLTFIALSAIWLGQHYFTHQVAHLYLLPLHGGAAVFARNADGQEDFLFDCGNETQVAQITSPFLAAQGMNRLQNMALTVERVQSGGGAEQILTDFTVKHLYTSPARARSPAMSSLVDSLGTKTQLRQVQAGDHISGWAVLNPFPANADSSQRMADDKALVFYKKIRGHNVLLLSSLGRGGQDALVSAYPNLKADIVVASLPAQGEPLAGPLLALLRPKLVIILDSGQLATARLSGRARDRLAARGAVVFVAHEQGAMELLLRPGKWELRDVSEGKIAP